MLGRGADSFQAWRRKWASPSSTTLAPMCAAVAMHLNRMLAMSVSAVLFAACASSGADQPPVDESRQQATLPQNLCDLLPQADAERIMSSRSSNRGMTIQGATIRMPPARPAPVFGSFSTRSGSAINAG